MLPELAAARSVQAVAGVVARNNVTIFRADLAEPVLRLAQLLAASSPALPMPMRDHPTMAALLAALDTVLDRSTWRREPKPAAAAAGEPASPATAATATAEGDAAPAAPSAVIEAPDAAAADDAAATAAAVAATPDTASPQRASKPYFRTRLRAAELAAVADVLAQYDLWTPGRLGAVLDLLVEAQPAAYLPASGVAKVVCALARVGAVVGGAPGEAAPHVEGCGGMVVSPAVAAAIAAAVSAQASTASRRVAAIVAYNAWVVGLGGPELYAQLLARLSARSGGADDILPPPLLAGALTARAAMRLRSARHMAATGVGYAIGSPGVEAALAGVIVAALPKADAYTLATLAKAAGTLGLSLTRAASPEDTAATVAATGAAPADGLWAAVEARALELLPSMAPVDVSYMAASFARAHRLVALETMKQAAAASAAAAELARRTALGGAPPLHAGALEAAAAARGPLLGSPALWGGISEVARIHAARFSPSDLSHLAWAFSRVGLPDPDLFRVFTDRMRALLDHSPPDGAGAAWVCMAANFVTAYDTSGIGTQPPVAPVLADLLSTTARAIFDAVPVPLPPSTSDAAPAPASAATARPATKLAHPSDLAALCWSAAHLGGLLGAPANADAHAVYLQPVRQLLVSVALRVNTEGGGGLAAYPNDAAYRLIMTGMAAVKEWGRISRAAPPAALPPLPSAALGAPGDKLARDPEADIVGDAVDRLRALLRSRGISPSQEARMLAGMAGGRQFRGGAPAAAAGASSTPAAPPLGMRAVWHAWRAPLA